MMEPRVKARLWVQMALRLGDIEGCHGAVLRKGDPDAGGVLVVLRQQERMLVLSQIRSAEGELSWLRGTGHAPVDQATVDAYLERRVSSDPDLWILEFETMDLKPPFDARIL